VSIRYIYAPFRMVF